MRPTCSSSRTCEAGGHELLVAGPLEPVGGRPPRCARTVRAARSSPTGPFTESVEQVVGFYLVALGRRGRPARRVRAVVESRRAPRVPPDGGVKETDMTGRRPTTSCCCWATPRRGGTRPRRRRRRRYAVHGRFTEELERRGHTIIGGAELPRASEAKSLAPHSDDRHRRPVHRERRAARRLLRGQHRRPRRPDGRAARSCPPRATPSRCTARSPAGRRDPLRRAHRLREVRVGRGERGDPRLLLRGPRRVLGLRRPSTAPSTPRPRWPTPSTPRPSAGRAGRATARWW